MSKTILITGSTDGIGFETAKLLVSMGHKVLLHGRNSAKLAEVVKTLSATSPKADAESYVADLSRLDDVEALASAVMDKHESLDVLINNAGVFKVANSVADNGVDVRFMVNTIAPYHLTQCLLPLLGSSGRVVNLSSAAQAPVDFSLLTGQSQTDDDMAAYAQSKLAITMWTSAMTAILGNAGPMIVAVNPGSLLASKMVKEGFGVAGSDLGIGADILARAALSDEFEDASGKYFDNDAKRFASPHPDALSAEKCQALVVAIESFLSQ